MRQKQKRLHRFRSLTSLSGIGRKGKLHGTLGKKKAGNFWTICCSDESKEQTNKLEERVEQSPVINDEGGKSVVEEVRGWRVVQDRRTCRSTTTIQ